jgi:tetratricopeptide (TPR) repeat protein
MPQTLLHKKWLEQLLDPYAVLGISVNADERQISKRYHTLAKLLHPDSRVQNYGLEQELAEAVFTQLVNPAYHQVKSREKRLSIVAQMRIQSCSLDTDNLESVQTTFNRNILLMSLQEAEIFYRQVVACYATEQYRVLSQSFHIIQKLNVLNLVYLWLPNRKEPVPTSAAEPIGQSSESQSFSERPKENYAQRYYERAVQYTKQTKWELAVQELRDAIKIEPDNSDYHALLGAVHFHQQFLGMSRVYIRQALKLNPQNPLALNYAAKLTLKPNENASPQSMTKALSIAALLSNFLPKKSP